MNILRLFFRSIILLCLLWICTACPYESPVPISAAQLPIDRQLLGKWTDSPESNDFFEVKAKGEFIYLIEENVFSKARKVHEIKKYYAHFSSIDAQLFLNISPRDSLEKPIRDDFLLYQLVKKDSTSFSLTPLSEHIDEKFTTSSDLQGFIQKYMNLSFFYGKEISFQRFDFKAVKWQD